MSFLASPFIANTPEFLIRFADAKGNTLADGTAVTVVLRKLSCLFVMCDRLPDITMQTMSSTTDTVPVMAAALGKQYVDLRLLHQAPTMMVSVSADGHTNTLSFISPFVYLKYPGN